MITSTAIAFASLVVGAILQPDATCVTAGVLVVMGKANVATAFAGCLAGTFIGDVFMVGVGRVMGQSILNSKLRAFILDRQGLARWNDWITHHAPKAAFMSRFVPGMSMVIHWSLGIVCRNPGRLILPLLSAGVLYVTIVMGATYFLAEKTREIADRSALPPTWMMVAAALGFWVAYRVIGWLVTRFWRSRLPALRPVSSEESSESC